MTAIKQRQGGRYALCTRCGGPTERRPRFESELAAFVGLEWPDGGSYCVRCALWASDVPASTWRDST